MWMNGADKCLKYRARLNKKKVVAKLATSFNKVVARDEIMVARNSSALNEEKKTINHFSNCFYSGFVTLILLF